MAKRNAIRKTGRSRFLVGKNKKYRAKRKYRKRRGLKGYKSKARPFTVTTFKGIKRPLNWKTEMKYTELGRADVTYNAAGCYTIWANNAFINASENTYLDVPDSGVAANARIGIKINTLFVDLCFHIEWNNPIIAGLGALTNVVQQPFRLAVVRSRDNIGTAAAPNPFGTYNRPIDTKIWDVQYDKMWYGTTGTNIAGQPIRFQSTNRRFRFRIPMKETVDVQFIANANVIQWSKWLGVYLWCDNGMQLFTVTKQWCKLYYKDP